MTVIFNFFKKMKKINGCSKEIDQYISLNDEIKKKEELGTIYEDEIAAYDLLCNNKKEFKDNTINAYLRKSKMTVDEFLFTVANYEMPVELRDSLYDRNKFPDARNENIVLETLIKSRELINDEVEKIAFNLTKGHNTELYLVNALQRGIKVSDLLMMQNVYIGNAEHDILLVCNKGVFTIEVKDHATQMSWDEKGNFTEKAYGKYIGKSVDPYEQTMRHENEFNKITNSNLCRGVVILANEESMPLIYNNEIAERIFYLQGFINFINSLPDILSSESVEKIIKTVDKIKYSKVPRFDFPDLRLIDQRFIEKFDLHHFNVYKKYDKFEMSIQEYVDFKTDNNKKSKSLYSSISGTFFNHDKNLDCGYRLTFLIVLSYIYLYRYGGLIPYDKEIILAATLINIVPRVIFNIIYRIKWNGITKKQKQFLNTYNSPFPKRKKFYAV